MKKPKPNLRRAYSRCLPAIAGPRGLARPARSVIGSGETWCDSRPSAGIDRRGRFQQRKQNGLETGQAARYSFGRVYAASGRPAQEWPCAKHFARCNEACVRGWLGRGELIDAPLAAASGPASSPSPCCWSRSLSSDKHWGLLAAGVQTPSGSIGIAGPLVQAHRRAHQNIPRLRSTLSVHFRGVPRALSGQALERLDLRIS
jgi:hypothetical protein